MSKKPKFKNIMFPVVMISLALALRQMSMTIVSPFISTYCKSLTGYTPLLSGLAVGIFGLMQAIFQIPFGILSDRYGNKRVLLSGLVLVIAGFILGFLAQNIWLLIFARALQGSGAIIGVGYAWVAKLADNQTRTKAMSILGGFISAAAALAFAIGPLLRGIMPVNCMFLAGGILLSINTLYILIFIKDKKESKKTTVLDGNQITSLLRNRTFVTMNIVAFLNNFMMMSVFYAAPIYMDQVTGQNGMWKIFIPAIIISILFMKASIRWVNKGYKDRVLLVAFAVAFLSILFYFNPSSFICLLLGTSLFLCGYITIATLVATLANEVVEDSLRGTGNGIFNSFQYIGNFAGAFAMGAVWPGSQKAAWLIVIVAGVVGFLLVGLGRHFKKKSINRKDEHMKDRILDVVARLIERYGLKKFTVDEVAAEAGISKKTLYQYFSSKDEMIRLYFEEIITSDQESALSVMDNKQDLFEKIYAMVHSNHRYRIPLQILDEAKQFYPDEWTKIEALKQFKLDMFQQLLEEAAKEGILRENVHFGILSSILERISSMFLDTDFLLENGLKSTQAIDEALNIIIHGIVKTDDKTS